MRDVSVVVILSVVLVVSMSAIAHAQPWLSDNAIQQECASVAESAYELFYIPPEAEDWESIFDFPSEALPPEYASKFGRVASQIIPQLNIGPIVYVVRYLPEGPGFKGFVVTDSDPDRPLVFFVDEGFFTEYTDEAFAAFLAHEFAHVEYERTSPGGEKRSEAYFDARGAELTSIDGMRSALETAESVVRSVRDRHKFDLTRCSSFSRLFRASLASTAQRLNDLNVLETLAAQEEDNK